MNIRGRRSVRGSDPLRLDADGNPATPQHRINSPRPRTFSRAAPLNAGAAHGRSATRTPRVKVGTPSTVSPPRTAGLNRSSANTSKSIGVSSGELSFFSPQPGVESGHAPVLSTVVPSPEGCSIQMPRHLIQPTIPAEVRVVPAIASADSGSSPNREFDDNPLDGPLAAPLIEPDPTNQEESVIAFRRARRRSSLPVASIIERGPNSTIELPHRVPTPLGSAIDAAVATNPRGGHIPQRGGSAAASPEGSPLEGQAFRLRPQWRRSRASLYEDDTTNDHHSSSPSSTEGAQVLPSPSTPNAAPTAVFARHMNWAAASPRSGSAPEGRVDDASTRLATLNAPRHPPTPRMLYAPSRKIEEASVIKKTPHAPESANGVPHQHRRLSAAQQYVNGPGTGVRRHLPRSEDEEEGEDSVPRVHSSNAKKDKNHSSHHHGKLPNIMKASSPSHTAAVAPAPDPVEPTPKARPRRAVGASVNREYETVIKEVDRAVGDIAIAHAQLRQTAEEIASLLHSWELLTPRRSEFGQELYQVLLQSHVTYRNMFAKTDVRRQSESFMKMLDRGVVSFSHPAMLITLMQEVGARHRLYRVDVVHFLAMRDVFLRLFPKYVPVEVFQRALPMWECFWEMVIDLTVQGASSTRGAYFNSMHHEIWAEHVQRLFARLVDLQRGSPEDDDCEHLFFLELARKAANQHIGNHEVELFHSTRSCDRLMDALIHIVQALKSREDATRTLTEYRSKGVFIGFYSHIGSALRQSFVETCEDYLHRDLLWGAVAARSMGELWDYIFETLAELDEKDKASKSISGAGGMGPEHSDPFCLLYADVEGSTRLWDANPRVMKVAIENYQRAVRGVIEKYSGYEVKTVGDSFLIATRDPLSALKIALAIQFQFMRGPIAEGFKMLESTQGSGDHKSWRNDSLRIRIGIHYCTDSTAVRDPVHQRYDYYGPDVNCAARVEAAACGGQILMTKAALSVLESMPGYTCEECPMALEDWHNTEDDDEICGAPLKDFCTAQYVGDFPICGYMKVVKLFSVCHKSLAGRVFAAPRTPAAALTS